MQQRTDETTARKPGRMFYYMAIALMLVAVATSIIQKRRESAVGMAAARRAASVAMAGTTRGAIGAERADEYETDVRQKIEAASRWRVLSLAAVSLGVFSWVVALRRREKLRWGWASVVVLLSLAVMLQLMMV